MNVKYLSIGIFLLFIFGSVSSNAELENNNLTNAIEFTNYQSNYIVVDTYQNTCYDNSKEIPYPNPGEPFYGQDAQYHGTAFAFEDNEDGTISDLNTDLMWQQTPVNTGFSWQEAVDYCNDLELAGYDDWRIPSLKELFSISDFSQGWPYLDTNYFDIAGPSVSKDEQYWTSNFYVGLTHNGAPSAFGVNHGTGHIKAYPASGGGPMGNYVRAVRGDSYGSNEFEDNGDGTVTDTATGLMWQQVDSGIVLDWEDALSYAEDLGLAGYDDWRLPNVKELQSIVDYTKSPNAIDPEDEGPAIDTNFFEITEIEPGTTNYDPDYGYFWTSTSAYHSTHSPEYYYAWYVAFGTAPDKEGDDSHGAGAVRFDTKVEGGPSGEDGARIYNYVRCVRGGLSDNQAPEKPETPDGPASGNAGTEYSYSTSTSDPEGNQVYYWFDWDDGSNSEWLGPYNSGEKINSSHIWDSKGSYNIRVKTKDSNGAQSEWSDPLSVTMPRNKIANRPIIKFLEQYPILYQLLQRFLQF